MVFKTTLIEHSEPVTALVFIDNADWESIRLTIEPQFLAIIERSTARLKAEGGLSSQRMRHEFGLY